MNEQREPDGPGRFKGENQHGYSPDVGRGSEEVAQAGDRAFDTPPDDEGPGREISEAERQGVPATDTEARTPLGVGVSESTRAEELAAREEEEGREPAGVHEKTGRPYGTSGPEHGTGVTPQEPIDEESPTLPPGDQAG